ncbi:NAD(P)-binding domain protein [Metarhizium guizhouense ARSEF 977]|uniref:NAD(P)-binding domain protein n=1 Tax=Metarhizium guizhouense (strain ARSEF 977) TaxID=1276136 RepID=A0A0B4H4N0_METGA|nr:NAD(P)-binding domain protein [Metarhizium guizhouense ARSEF 977]
MAPQHITFIGIGNMGITLAQTLHKAGHSTTIRNITRHRLQVDKVIELGAELEQDAEIAISRSGGLVIICVLDHDAIYKALDKVPSSARRGMAQASPGRAIL